MDDINKENLSTMSNPQVTHVGTPLPAKSAFKAFSNTSLPIRGPRTPLLDVNGKDRLFGVELGNGKAVKMLQYGPSTPISAPSGRNKEREMFSLSSSSEPNFLSTHRAPSVQYKKIMGAFKTFRQDFEDRLESKDEYIKSLEDKICISPFNIGRESEKIEISCSTSHTESNVIVVDSEKLSSEEKVQNQEDEILSADAEKSKNVCIGAIEESEAPSMGTSPHRTPMPLRRLSVTKSGTTNGSSPFLAYLSPSKEGNTHVSPSKEKNCERRLKNTGCSPIKMLDITNSSSLKQLSPKNIKHRRASLQLLKVTDADTLNADIIHRRASLQMIPSFQPVAVYVTTPGNTSHHVNFSNKDKVDKCADLDEQKLLVSSEPGYTVHQDSEVDQVSAENVISDVTNSNDQCSMSSNKSISVQSVMVQEEVCSNNIDAPKKIELVDGSCQAGDVNANICEDIGTEACNFASETDDACTNTDNIICTDNEVNTSFILPSNEIGMNTSVNYEALDNVDIGINTSLFDTISTEHTSTNTEIIELEDICLNTSIVTSDHVGINTSILAYIDVGINTSVVSDDTSMNTEHVDTCEQGVNTNALVSGEIGVNTELFDVAEFGVNTDHTGSVDLKKESTESGTCVTPKKYQSVAVSTSPTCLYVARPSQIGTVNFTKDDLKDQLESASISNKLLRGEIEVIKSKEDEVKKELETARTVSSRLEDKIKDATYQATRNLQEQVDELMCQQSSHLNQLSRVEAQLTREKSAGQDAQMKHERQVILMKDQINELQTDLKLAYKSKQTEVKALEEKFSKEDYKTLYQRSHNRLTEAQEKLNVFAKLVDQLQDSRNIQVEAQKILEKGLKKVKEVAQKNLDNRNSFEKEVGKWKEDKMRLEVENDIKQKEYTQTQEKHQVLIEKLEIQHKEILQYESQLKEAEEKVQAAERAVVDFSTVNQSLIQGLDEHADQIKELEAQKEGLKSDLQIKTAHMESMQDICQEMTHELVNVKKEYVLLESENCDFTDKIKSLKESYTKETGQLQQLLTEKQDELERDNKSVHTLQDVCTKQKGIIGSLEQDLIWYKENAREAIVLQDQLKRLQQSSKENQEFIEEERTILREELEDSRARFAVLKGKYDSVVAYKDQLIEQLQEEKDRGCQIMSELDHVKAEAHMMLLQQGSEITTGLESLSKLSHRIHAMYNELKRRCMVLDEYQQCGDMEKSLSHSVLSDHNLTDGQKMAVGKSFLNSVLTAISEEDLTSDFDKNPPETQQGEEGRNNSRVVLSSQDNVESNSSLTAEQFGVEQLSPITNLGSTAGSAFSAFTKVKPASQHPVENATKGTGVINQVQDNSYVDNNERLSSESVVNDSAACMNKADETERVTDNTNQEDGDEESSLCVKMESLFQVIGEMIAIVKVLDNAFAENENRLHSRICELEKTVDLCQLDKSRSLKDQEDRFSSLELKLIDCNQREKQLKSNLIEAKQRCTDSERDLSTVRQMLQEKTLALDTILEQNSQDQSLQEQVLKLKRTVKQKENDVKFLQENIDSLLSKVENKAESDGGAVASSYSTAGADSKYIRENYLLKAEVNKLRQKNVLIKEEMEELANKANSRQKTYQLSLNKAEEEIATLDNTIDKLRYLLRKHKDTVRMWPDAKDVWKEVVYDKRLDDASMKWSS